MSNTVTETLVVESVTQFGIRANGRSYSLSPKLKESGIEPNSFVKGGNYQVEVWTGPKGGKSINSFSQIGATSIPVPPPPALPPTTVTETKAPGGVAPVAPARKASVSDEMTKADWANKDRLIGIDAVIKSSLESPALAQMVVGKNENEAFDLSRRYVQYNLETQRLAKSGTL